MTLNPIVAVSEQLQKLINEHGSASILRERLGLAKDQALILEKKLSELTLERDKFLVKVSVLEADLSKLTVENSRLRTENQTLLHEKQILIGNLDRTNVENKGLKAKIEELEKTNNNLRRKIQEHERLMHKNLLDEPKINILKLLFKNGELDAEDIAQAVQCDVEAAKMHLGDLRKKGLAREDLGSSKRDAGFTTVWSIEQEGRRLIIEKKI